MALGARIKAWRQQLQRPGVRGAIYNTGWLTSERVVRLGVGAAVGVWIARVLGPDQYGVLSYALALATIFGSVANLGTDSVVVRELVTRPDRADAILDSATGLRAAGALGATVLASVAAMAMHRSEPVVLVLVLVFATATLFKPFDIVDLWCQARVDVRPAVWARNAAFLAGTAARVAVVWLGGPLLALAAAEPFAAAVGAALLVGVLRRRGRTLSVARWEPAEARALLRASWPLLFAGIAVVVYMRIDQVMLERLAGPNARREVGLYSAALRLSEVWYFIPTALVTAVFPHLVSSKAKGESLYLARFAHLFGLMNAIALAVAIPMTFLAGPLTRLLYGPSFADSAPILAIHIWTTVFVFWGVVGETWFLNEGLTHLSLWRTVAAACVNVALNLVWIPRLGGVGAATATLVAQACAAWLFNAVDERTRPMFALQARSLLMKGVLW
jgi:PST family polysaccharide transporter